MKKVFKITAYSLLGLVVIFLITVTITYLRISSKVNANYELLGPEAPTLESKRITYHDLNKNSKLDVYEDISANIDDRCL